MNDIRIRLIIEGRVQGVWFRESTRRQAISLGVTGWVKNRPDSTVEVVAEGPEEQVNDLVSWCGQGPPVARVDKIHKTEEKWTGEFDSFEVVYW